MREQQRQQDTQHTPTPWRLTDNSIVSEAAWLIPPSDGEEGIPLSVIDLHGAMGGEDGDAEFIVTACNSFDAMREALRLALPVVESAYLDDSDRKRETSMAVSFEAQEAIRAALQAAEGEGER